MLRFLRLEKIHRPQLGLNLQTLDLEASTFPRDRLLYWFSVFNSFQKEKFNGDRSEEDMMQFILSRLHVSVVNINADVWENSRGSSSWLLAACYKEDSACLDVDTQLKLAAMLVMLFSYHMRKSLL